MLGASDRSRHDAGAEPEPSFEPAGRQTRDRRDEEQQQEEQQRRDQRPDAEEPEREERERSDSLAGNVLGLIRRMLPRQQPVKKPYVFKAFPTSSVVTHVRPLDAASFAEWRADLGNLIQP
jgi:hypothetical protein